MCLKSSVPQLLTDLQAVANAGIWLAKSFYTMEYAAPKVVFLVESRS